MHIEEMEERNSNQTETASTRKSFTELYASQKHKNFKAVVAQAPYMAKYISLSKTKN